MPLIIAIAIVIGCFMIHPGLGVIVLALLALVLLG